MSEKVYVSEVRFAVQQIGVGEKREYLLYINLGATIMRVNADSFDKFIETFAEKFQRGDIIYLPQAYNWK